MRTEKLQWTLSHTRDLSLPGADPVPALLPEEAQLSYARAKGYAPYTYGTAYRQFDWMEKEYFLYDTVLSFTAGEEEKAFLYFSSVDYRYTVLIDGKCAADGEGIFTPLYLDVTAYSGKPVPLRVILHPIPSHAGEEPGRAEARFSCKPPSSYGWDWHPRLVPTGIIGDCGIMIGKKDAPRKVDVSYRINDTLTAVALSVSAVSFGGTGDYTAVLRDPEGNAVLRQRGTFGGQPLSVTLQDPRLWYPRTYGEQPIYRLELVPDTGGECLTRNIGFRRSRLLRNDGDAERFGGDFPKTSLPVPATVEINGVRVFAKGSNWVNAEIFPSRITEERTEELLRLAYDANMNILRLWGGQYFNSEYFYDLCDRYGILVWQEFMLSCNNYPDDPHYLSVLEQEASTLIRRLRSHPCIAFWTGGNELFNSWSGMTCQSHALRLLNKLCYELDPDTPFNMTSPLQGMAHGTYVKCVGDGKGGTEEFLQVMKRTDYNAYTEFGCNGGASPAYIRKYIMDEADYRNCRPDNAVWRAHHAFGAWGEEQWLGIPDVNYFFGGYTDTDDLMEKSLFLQAMTYQTMFEEMRRRWPRCSMAVNWDLNEPWPCAAGNSLLNWPAEPKEAYTAVKNALRPTLFSLCADKNRFMKGEIFTGTVWILNDSPDPLPGQEITVTLRYGEKRLPLGNYRTPPCPPRANAEGETFSFTVPEDTPERFAVLLTCQDRPAYDTGYRFVCSGKPAIDN